MEINYDLFVSVIIPCRNEEKFIGMCLDSVIVNDYPKDRFEVLVVDGMSKDGTREIAKGYVKEHPFIKLFDNPKKIIPSAMNIGIKNASGEIIMKIDSHARYPENYISKCVSFLAEYNADNVGGVIVALPRNNTTVGKAIVLSLSHPFGVGNSLFRIGSKKPIWADTAFSGCYKREVFKKIGLYDENIARSEDVLINSKLRKSGGKILLVPEIISYYYARSNLWDFIKHNFDNGFWITYPLKFFRTLFSWRHLVPLVFVLVLISLMALSIFSPVFLLLFLFIIGPYVLINIYFSIKITYKEKDFRYLFLLPVIFALLHLCYGIGSVWGLLKVIISKKFWINLKSILTEG